MIGSKIKCRNCLNFRPGEIIVIDVMTGCQNCYDGECLDKNTSHGLIAVNLSDDCPNFYPKSEAYKP